MKSIPSWLSDVKVRFTCEVCRQKHPKPVAGYETPAVSRAARDEDAIDDPELIGVVVDDDEDVVDDIVIEPDAAFEDVPDEP